MRGRRHRSIAAAAALMTAGCGDMVGIGPLDVDSPPEITTSPTSPPPPGAPDGETPIPTTRSSTVDASTKCTERETPFLSPRIVFGAGAGCAWDMISAIKSEDGVSARAIPDLTTNDTQLLVAVAFGFDVPPNAIVRGVTLEVRVRQGLGPPGGTRDKLVTLAPFEGAANLKLDAPYSDALLTRSYRGDAKRWGVKLTPAAVNAPEFGVAFQSVRTVYPFNTSVEVDAMRMKIAYCE